MFPVLLICTITRTKICRSLKIIIRRGANRKKCWFGLDNILKFWFNCFRKHWFNYCSYAFNRILLVFTEIFLGESTIQKKQCLISVQYWVSQISVISSNFWFITWATSNSQLRCIHSRNFAITVQNSRHRPEN